MTEFTPVAAAVGGALIGSAAILLMLTVGRIAGVSGFISRLLPPYQDNAWPTRLAFIVGLASAPWLLPLAGGPLPAVEVNATTGMLIAAGLLVGVGAVLGGGCTSGHGVCGTARLSPRSLAATGIFMTTGIATVWLLRHGLGG